MFGKAREEIPSANHLSVSFSCSLQVFGCTVLFFNFATSKQEPLNRVRERAGRALYTSAPRLSKLNGQERPWWAQSQKLASKADGQVWNQTLPTTQGAHCQSILLLRMPQWNVVGTMRVRTSITDAGDVVKSSMRQSLRKLCTFFGN